jgi:hypothetical protein
LSVKGGEPPRVAQAVQEDGSSLPDPFAGESKWAAWKVTLFVILFCGAFWSGVAWLVLRLLP